MISPALPCARPRQVERGATISLGAHWHRVALLVVTALSAALNFIGLSREGYNNEFYAAAVKSMSESWHNFFFNSFDPGGFVTIDKPPLGFWFQVASVKLFGFSGVSLLIPQALAGVLSVLLLCHLVARTFGRPAGLLAALALAITPISVVTSRNNTIDSTLVLFLLLGAWAVLRAAETGKLRWLLLCAVFVGLGFNVKMLEAYLVVPAFGLVYLLGTHKSLWRRVGNLFLALVVLLAVSLSWATAVDLTPASQRPWVDSTTNNSEISLAVGYNGLQRLTGNHSLSGASASQTGGNGGPGGVGENGPTGALRLLDAQLGSQIGWFLPIAVLGFLVAAWRSRPRFRLLDDRQRSLVLWGAWLLTTGAFFSVALFYHTYYLVTVAPAISALAGIAIVSLWQEYRRPGSRTWWLLPLGLLVAAGVEAHILASYPSWARWLTPIVVGGTGVAAISVVVVRLRFAATARAAIAGVMLAVLALMASPAAFAAYTTQHTETGAIVRAGPSASGSSQGPGGFSGGPPSGASSQAGGFGPPPSGSGNPPSPPSGSTGTAGGSRLGAFAPPSSTTGNARFGASLGGAGHGGDQVSTALVTYLEEHRGTATYLVATMSSNQAAPIIIATGDPVMSLGGFSGSDPILTTAKLASLAKRGVVRYFLLSGGGFGGPGGGSSSLTTWIQQHSKLITVGGAQLYEYTG
jgi:4-amino-4-deoxy-L-arabinose transferase-like glycosyltransferase